MTPVGPTGAPAEPPPLVPWLLAYTFARLAIVAALVALIWVLGLPGFPALLFGLLLGMPVAYLALRPMRERLTEAIAARSVRKQQIRADLRGEDDPAG
ncbi:hypothetical protein A7K94_0216350 [Modestobacter sp. VKM Ac-2676]|nr:hypothetical protein A7K94_0216350 [Modestobacter sp. VKM Ac-2676]